MLRKKAIIGVAVVFLLIVSSLLVTANAAIEQRGVLSGRVLSALAQGTDVREGDILVQVDTLTGPVPAARATNNGVVTQMLVKPGDSIKIGDTVARIEVGK